MVLLLDIRRYSTFVLVKAWHPEQKLSQPLGFGVT
jgi:hypothetical protein